VLHAPDHVRDVRVRIRILEGDDRQALIDQGRLLAQGTLAELTSEGQTLEDVYLALTGDEAA